MYRTIAARTWCLRKTQLIEYPLAKFQKCNSSFFNSILFQVWLEGNEP